MKDKKLQVFVSSTFTDLKDERQAAVEAILSSGNIPAGMELFAAGDESQMTVIERWIDESDVYLLILGGRYGSVEKHSHKSYTHLEYEYALKNGKPLFAVVISELALDEKVKIMGRGAIEQECPKELADFRNMVCCNLVRFWEDKKDIKISIHETLSEFSYRKDLLGWIRSDNLINAGFLAEEIARLTRENSELRTKLSSNKGATPLYSNLSFEELKELLEQENVTHSGEIISLYELFLKMGKQLSGSVSGFSDEEGIRNLELLLPYKVIYSKLGIGGDFKVFMLTDDGHNFFLKSMAIKKSKQ